MSLSRRKFIQISSLASASILLPKFLSALSLQGNAVLQPSAKKLIVIQLTGGNDGLNTIVPFRNDLYYTARPRLGLFSKNLLMLSDEVGLHPSLKQVKTLYDEGAVSILNSVGYSEPVRSHVESMNIWHTGYGCKGRMETGWLGRWMDTLPQQTKSQIIRDTHLDLGKHLALKGRFSPELLHSQSNSWRKEDGNILLEQNPYGQMLTSSVDPQRNVELVSTLYGTTKRFSSKGGYPDSTLGARCKSIANLISTEETMGVFYASHGSFDTHVNQQERHKQLFDDLDLAIAALVEDLKAAGKFEDTLIMTFSEFGRRVQENNFGGTDHGTAGPMFFISGGLKKPGLYNDLPSLSNLDEGDLRYALDFRQAYATVLDKWLDANSNDILGNNFQQLTFL